MIVLINGREGPIKYIQITSYERQEGKWKPKPSATGALQLTNDEKHKNQAVNCGQNPHKTEIHQIQERNKLLGFEFQEKPWYKATNNPPTKSSLVSAQTEPKSKEISEIWKEKKYGFWIWVENSKSSSHMFKDLNYSFKQDDKYKWMAWRFVDCSQTYFPGDTSLRFAHKQQIDIAQTQIQKLSKGTWVNTEEFCNYSHKRNISENEFKNLKLFCAKPIASS